MPFYFYVSKALLKKNYFFYLLEIKFFVFLDRFDVLMSKINFLKK